MLKHLLKHEFKTTSRYFIPMFLMIAITTIFLKLSLILSETSIFMSLELSTFIDIIQGLFIMLYSIVIIGTIFLSGFLLIRRFYVNLFGDEGYLMHTLPVTGGQLLNSKLICSFIWLLLLITTGFLSFFLLFVGTGIYTDLSHLIPMVIEELTILNISGFSIGTILAEFFILIPLTIIASLLMYYLCITLGHQLLGNHPILGAIIVYFSLNILTSMIQSVFHTTMNLVSDHVYLYASTTDLYHLALISMTVNMVVSLLQAVIYYLVVRYLLTKKVNLY